jgi:ABC-type transport system involved in cytochrome c biogenesis permease subunit
MSTTLPGPEVLTKTKPATAFHWTDFLKPIASLKLTVSLFAMSIVLVFFGTVAQKNSGIWTVVDVYFWSYWVKIELQLIAEFLQIFLRLPASFRIPGWIPFPAGKTIGFVMFANLLAAHTLQLTNLIRITRKQAEKGKALGEIAKVLFRRTGIYILHGGLLLLFVGEYITREFQIEQNMWITEGSSSNFTFDTKRHELAFSKPDPQDGNSEITTVVPISHLREAMAKKQVYSHPEMPVDVELLDYFPNSQLRYINEKHPAIATNGDYPNVTVIAKPEVSGASTEQKIDTPGGFIKLLKKGTSETLGVYKLSVNLNRDDFKIDGQVYGMELRHKRYHKPYTLMLKDFRFDKLPGTMVAKNYSSEVTLIDPERGPNRDVTISMNDPLRHRGEAFFQSSFLPSETTTILQVVDNPGYVIPYVSCVMVTVGMLLHFMIGLLTFVTSGTVRSARSASDESPSVLSRILPSRVTLPYGSAKGGALLALPIVFVTLTLLYAGTVSIPGTPKSDFDLEAFGKLPVQKDGRFMPLDTSARVQMRMLTNREEYYDLEKNSQPAIRWYLETMASSPEAPGDVASYRLFRIENDRLKELLKLERRESMRYSLLEIKPQFGALEAAWSKATDGGERRPKEGDLLGIHATELYRHLQSYLKVMIGADGALLPPKEGQDKWRVLAQVNKALQEQAESPAIRERFLAKLREAGLPQNLRDFDPEQLKLAMTKLDEIREVVLRSDSQSSSWNDLISAYRNKKPKEFNQKLEAISEENNSALSSGDQLRIKIEHYMNQTAFYYHCIFLYILSFLVTLVSMFMMFFSMKHAEGLRRAALGIMVITFVLHALTLLGRMYLMDRPLVFVTNLYSSAIFIGFAAVLSSIVIERIFAIGIGNLVGSFVGGGTCIVAHNLAVAGDVLEPLQAVLDTNIWLATHVTTVTLGYAASYVAGIIGLVYLVLGIATPALTKKVPFSMGNAGKEMEIGRVIGMLMYGVICFAVLFSFVGTVLGGIWADQSWGRFWGWDPKENGAVLIVVWNAMILHARWAGLVKDRGIAVLLLGGNMVTTWSWFGTNQLGVGLHAYGFNDNLRLLCDIIWISHLALIGFGLIPKRYWVSYNNPFKT